MDCPFYSNFSDCLLELTPHAYNLINRQNAKIERLQEEINQMSDDCEMCSREYTDDVFGVLKEFAKKFREKADTVVLNKEGIIELRINDDDFDDLVKEMVGE